MQLEIEIVEKLLKNKGIIAQDQAIQRFERLHGGSINDSFLVITSQDRFFIKMNRRKELPHFFECERKGLELLRGASELKVPKVIAISDSSEQAVDILVLEYLEETSPAPTFWKNFGMGLATLHQNSSSHFGLDYNNYIGSLKQSNTPHDNWIEFFVNERLNAQYNLARDQGFLDEQFGRDLDRLYNKIDQIIPNEPAALLHGDLWSGNFKVVGAAQAAIFDPAVYFGHREVDLAMMHLFGGFQQSLFDAYHEVFPLEAGWEERIDLFNLYPLLVHVNLFAGSYTSRARQVLKKYI